MRIFVKLTRNTEIIPFNYQHLITGAIHKWIGKENQEHGAISLYSFAWLQNVQTNNKGISLTRDSYFFISAFDEPFIKTIINGILNEPEVCCGSKVFDVQVMQTPQFEIQKHFLCASPVFIKRRTEDKEKENHITFNDELSGQYLTETLKNKLSTAGLSTEGVSVEFDKAYSNPQTKVIHYKNIKNRANICPVIIKGTPEQVAFAWNVGVGNSTGIGFGALK